MTSKAETLFPSSAREKHRVVAHEGRMLSHFFLSRGDKARRRNVGLVLLLAVACCVCLSPRGWCWQGRGGDDMSCLRMVVS